MVNVLPRKISLAISTLLFIFVSPVNALPGDNINVATGRLNNSVLLRGVPLRETRLGNHVSYSASFRHRGNPARVAISSPDRPFTNSLIPSISILQNPPLGFRLIRDGYNLRQDEEFLELLTSIWGNSLVQDFRSSRFTDRQLEQDNNRTFRTAYKGQRFGYIASWYCSDIDCTFYFHIYSHNDWEFHRKPAVL